MIFDVCVLGHITKDVAITPEGVRVAPGGTAYYTAVALKHLGARVAVITKLRDTDAFLLHELEKEHIPVFLGHSGATTTFRNEYPEGTATRQQWVKDVAEPFTFGDVSRCDAAIFHLGPLTKGDIPPELIRLLATKAQVSMDVQGFVRDMGKRGRGWVRVRQRAWKEKREVLAFVNILKASEDEADILCPGLHLSEIARELSGYGPQEVVITCGADPSLVYCAGNTYRIPAYAPRNTGAVDPTGCGDTYMAGYLFYRQKTDRLDEAGKFAAITAFVKLERGGPFTGGEKDVRDFANAVGQPLL